MSAAQGRFTSVDPALESEYLETPQTWNRYSYVYNQPLALTDPDGRCPQCLPAAVVGGIGGLVAAGAAAFYEARTTGTVNVRDLGAAFVGGAISSGLPVLTLGASLVPEAGFEALVVVGAGSNVIGGEITRSLDSTGRPGDLGAMTTDALLGGAGGFIGNGVGLLIERDFSPLRPTISKFGTKAFSRANRAYASDLARLRKIAYAAGTGVGTAISNAFYTTLSAFRPPSTQASTSIPSTPILPSWQSFLTFGLWQVPFVTSTISYPSAP